MRRILLIMFFVLLVILIIAIPKYIRDLRTARKVLSSYSPKIIDTPIAAVEYCRMGKGSPILISHGITGGFDQGLGLARGYIGDGYDLIAVSRFGYLGSSKPEDSSPDVQAKAYKYLLDDLGIEKTFIFGNSAGTAAAVKFALNYPDRCQGLILVSANVPTEKKVAIPPKPVMKIVFGSDFVYWSTISTARYNMLSAIGLSKSFRSTLTHRQKDKLLNEIVKSALPVSLRSKGIINDLYISNPDINKDEYKFEQIKVPVIMVHAKDDTLCSYKGAVAVSEKIPDIRFVDFETGGHLVLGHEKEICEAITDFVDSNSAVLSN